MEIVEEKRERIELPKINETYKDQVYLLQFY